MGRITLSMREVARLVQADGKATVAQTTTMHNCGEHKGILEFITRYTLRRINYNSRRPCLVTLL